MDFEAPQFPIPEVADAVGCPRPTLDAWRNRLNLFEDTVTRTKVEKRLSLTDACVARAVKLLTDAGISAKGAIMAADDDVVRAQIFARLSGETVSSVLGFRWNAKDGNEKPDLYFLDHNGFQDMLSKAGGVMIVIDLAAVIAHVLDALNISIDRK
ncbi:hypothetical protein ABIE85_008368 [Bradyrhizobium diazoefficiens]|jgi:hypothetical protein|uniref:hypothetical protein n=1 Tax=Bradyrhizobium diazoefficiens TaxID=1355477 RepID=UPI00272B3D84|nr:hypothetical protein [Bradyrhizobium diazoefficiens]WLA58537.1 hypothetical protein QIH81_07710 [Bradyrhizobium diazoefficiens]